MPGAAKASRLFLPIPENMSAPGIEGIIYFSGRRTDAGKESIPAGEQTRFGETGGKQNMEDCF